MNNSNAYPNGWKDGYSSADHATESYSPYANERASREAAWASAEREEANRRIAERNAKLQADREARNRPSPEEWARDKRFNCSGVGIKFKIQNNRFVFLTPPPSGMRIVFQYRSNNIVWDFNTFEEKSVLSSNTDVPIFDEYLVKLNILWRWLKRSGLDYTEEYQEYYRELKKRFGASMATKDIILCNPLFDIEQGVIINAITVNDKKK